MPLPRPLRRFAQQTDGWITPLSLMLVIGMFSVGGLAVEHLNVIQRKAVLRNATDAVALAAAANLPDQEAALTAALEMADLYFANGGSQSVITAEDIEFGGWDLDSLSFSGGADTVDAVQVTASLLSVRGNALQTVFTRMMGEGTIDVRARSIVRAEATSAIRCSNGGLFSEGWTTGNSNNSFTSGFCIYGGRGIDLGNNNSFSGGSAAILAPDGVLIQGNSNSGLTAAQEEAELDLPLPDSIGAFIAELQMADTSHLFGGDSYNVVALGSIPRRANLSENTLYIVFGSVSLKNNTDYSNMAIVATGDIDIGSNTTFDNVVLASNDDISTNSNVAFGASGYCDGGRYTNYLFARGDISFNANNTLLGVQMAARGDISMNSNISAIGDVHAETWGDITFNSNNSLNNCSDALTSDWNTQPEQELGDAGVTVGLVF